MINESIYTLKILYASTLTILFIFLLSIRIAAQNSYVPKDGFVNSDTTAIKIAEAIALPIYGDLIYQEMPFEAILIGDSVWAVTGTLPKSYTAIEDGDTIFHITMGGVIYIEIRKGDGKIVKVTHGK